MLSIATAPAADLLGRVGTVGQRNRSRRRARSPRRTKCGKGNELVPAADMKRTQMSGRAGAPGRVAQCESRRAGGGRGKGFFRRGAGALVSDVSEFYARKLATSTHELLAPHDK